MPRSKTQFSKLPHDLRNPIDVGRPSLALDEGELKAWWESSIAFVFSERLRKLHLLMTELQAPEADPQVRLLWLCVELAKKLYPGFRTTDADGARPKGRPKRAGLFFADLEATSRLADAFLQRGVVATDEEFCKMLLRITDGSLGKPRRKTELMKKSASLAQAISRARAKARREVDAKNH